VTWGFCLLNLALCHLALGQPVTRVVAGYGHSLFQRSDGSLWGMGWNWAGQLGDGTTNSSATNDIVWPERINSDNVVAIAAGTEHSLLIRSDGSLWVMGDNNGYQLGDGTTDSGNFYTNRPEQIVSNGVIAIAGGDQHSLFLKSDGSLWAMGANDYGQL